MNRQTVRLLLSLDRTNEIRMRIRALRAAADRAWKDSEKASGPLGPGCFLEMGRMFERDADTLANLLQEESTR